MTELIRIGRGFFEDLATTPETEARLLVDSRLTAQEFAAKHAETILDHYMNVFCFGFLREDAEFFATAIWHYLHDRRQSMTTTFTDNPLADCAGGVHAYQAA